MDKAGNYDVKCTGDQCLSEDVLENHLGYHRASKIEAETNILIPKSLFDCLRLN